MNAHECGRNNHRCAEAQELLQRERKRRAGGSDSGGLRPRLRRSGVPSGLGRGTPSGLGRGECRGRLARGGSVAPSGLLQREEKKKGGRRGGMREARRVPGSCARLRRSGVPSGLGRGTPSGLGRGECRGRLAREGSGAPSGLACSAEVEFYDFFVGQDVVSGDVLAVVDVRGVPCPRGFEFFGELAVDVVCEVGDG